MPDMVVCRVEQFFTKNLKPAALNFTFRLGIAIGDLLNDPDNDVNNEIVSPIIEGVLQRTRIKKKEDNINYDTNNDNSREIDESNQVDNNKNKFDNADEGVQTIDPTRGVKKIEPTGGVMK